MVVDLEGKILFWHLPVDRTIASLPDSRNLWDVLWDNRKIVAGFAHSHPGAGIPSPSWTDVTTFAAIEAGLGRRLKWWITSEDSCIDLAWSGPDKHHYLGRTMTDEPLWLPPLRKVSAGILRGETNLVAMIDQQMYVEKENAHGSE